MKKNKSYSKAIIKKGLILISLIAILITIYQIAEIYAVFHSQSLGLLNSDIAKWRIIVNGTNIVSEIVEEFEIEKLDVKDSKATNGKIAPGLEGSFEIIIDPKDTQVSVRYDILIDDSGLEGSDIKLISVKEIEKENTITKTDKKTYTGIIPLNDIKQEYINNIKLMFKWEIDGEGTGEDIEIEENTVPMIQIPISVKITQYLGEEIISYTE